MLIEKMKLPFRLRKNIFIKKYLQTFVERAILFLVAASNTNG
jgi:hypothetical protein